MIKRHHALGFVFLIDLVLLQISKFNCFRWGWQNNYRVMTAAFLAVNLFLLYFLSGTRPKPSGGDLPGRARRIGSILVVLLGLYFLSRSIFNVYRYAYFCQSADMLPIIEGSLRQLFHGASPYGGHYCSGTPLTYLPFQVMFFAPAYLLGWDLRIISLFSIAMAAFVLYRHFSENGNGLNAVLVPLAFLGMPLIQVWVIQIHIFPIFLLLCLLFYWQARGDLFPAMIAFGLILGMYHMMFVLAPLVLILLIREHGGTAGGTKKALLGLSMGLIIGFSFGFLRPMAFIEAQKQVFSFFSNKIKGSNLFNTNAIGAGNVFLSYFEVSIAKRILGLLQIFSLAGIWAFGIKHLRRENFPAFSFLALLAFTVFMPFTRSEEYYYLLCLAPLLFVGKRGGPKSAGRASLCLALPGVVIIPVLILFFPFSNYSKTRALDERSSVHFDYGFEGNDPRQMRMVSKTAILSFPLSLPEWMGRRIEIDIRVPGGLDRIAGLMVNDQSLAYGMEPNARRLIAPLNRKGLIIGNNRVTIESKTADPVEIQIIIRKLPR